MLIVIISGVNKQEDTMSFNSTTQPTNSYSGSAMNFLSNSRKSVNSTFSNKVNAISRVFSSVMKTISDAGSNLVNKVNYLNKKAINMVSTIRTTAHGSVDGMLLGMGAGFILGGPMGVGYGAWIGSVAGGVYGFSEATNNNFDRASFSAHTQQKEWVLLSEHQNESVLL